MCNETLIEVLQKAKDMEQKGYNFYKDAAEKSNNKITKKTFAFLADSEILHIESINIFFGSLKAHKEWKTLRHVYFLSRLPHRGE